MNKVTGIDQLQHFATQTRKGSNNQERVDTTTGEAKGNVKDQVEISSEALALSNQKTEQDTLPTKTSNILKMTDEQRAELVSKLKEEQEKNIAKMFDFVRDTIASQGTTFANTDDIWKFIASGKYTVDEQIKIEAQKAISEEGYYGVKQTSERIFEFALALTGGDEKQMKNMEKAIKEGFKAAEEAWGGKLPDITKETHDAVKQHFKDYYASLRPQENENANEGSSK